MKAATVERRDERATLSRQQISDPSEARAIAVAAGRFRAGTDAYRGAVAGFLIGYGARQAFQIDASDAGEWWRGFLTGYDVGDFAFRRDRRRAEDASWIYAGAYR